MDIGQPQQININLNDATDILCECGNGVFIDGMRFKKVSAIISPTGREERVGMQVYLCTNCGKELQPPME